jgi:adenylate kinase
MIKIGITGNPGVGKHTISKLLSKKMDLPIIDINDIIISNNTFITKNRSRTGEIDLKETRESIKNELLKKMIVVGHLLPYLIKKKN